MLAGCGGSAPIGAPGAMPRSGTSTHSASYAYRVVHSFNGKDGEAPAGNLTVFRGKLYGTTAGGAAEGDGGVFTIDSSGTEKTIYSFDGLSGKWPAASLSALKGTLYGTTSSGGLYGLGTVFSITKGGKESVLYSFRGGRDDGYQPLGGLAVRKGLLFGTTDYGDIYCGYHSGLFGCGTVFSVTPLGKETVLHKFDSNSPYFDGSNPEAGLVFLKGLFYGTTLTGGPKGLGTVFYVSATGSEGVLHNFLNGNGDGYLPSGSLIVIKGVLYGTTEFGGTGSDCDGAGGCGTVFSITPSGQEKVVYSFLGGSDGSDPEGSLIDVGGTLYGTTESGGAYCQINSGCGTIFSINTAGQEQVLHSFAGGSDGSQPAAGLTLLNGTLYGTTYLGGNSSDGSQGGYGTVFALQLQAH